MAVLKKVGIYYPALITKNSMSDKHQLNIGNLTDEHVKILVDDLGVDESQIKEPKTEFKNDEDGRKREAAEAQGRYIVARSEYPITVVDGKQKPLSDDVIKTIGNGSVANVQVNSYDWKFKQETGVSAGLQQVMLLKKEDYIGFTSEFDNEEDELSGTSGQEFDNEFDSPDL